MNAQTPGKGDGKEKPLRDLEYRICAEHAFFDCGWCFTYIPTGRPLAEAPILDFEALIEKNLPSDKRFAKLFPNDIAKWMKYRDLSTEWFIVDEYNCWISDLKGIEEDEGRRGFYEGLWRELDSDADDVWAEREVAFEGVGNLEQWEFENLDQDGGTKGIEGWSESEWVQMCWCLEAWERYRSLAPPGYEPTSWPWYKKRGHIDSPPVPATTMEESDSELQPPEPALESSAESSKDVPLDWEALGSSDEEEDQQQEPDVPVVAEAEIHNADYHQEVFDSMYI